MITVRRIAVLACAATLAACSTTSDAESAATTTSTSTAAAPTTTAAPNELAQPSTTTTVAATTTTTAPVECEPVPLADGLGERTGSGKAVAPGCYSVDKLSTPFVVEIRDDGYSFLEAEKFAVFAKDGTDWDQPNVFFLGEFVGVIPGPIAGTHPDHDVPIGSLMEPMPSDLADWFATTPQVVVLDSGQATVAGSQTAWWDVTVDPNTGDNFNCNVGWCIAALVPPPPEARGTNFIMGSQMTYRIMQFLDDRAGLFAWIQSFESSFEETVEMADDILSGVRFTD